MHDEYKHLRAILKPEKLKVSNVSSLNTIFLYFFFVAPIDIVVPSNTLF